MKICKFVPEFNFAAFIYNLAVCTKLGGFKFSFRVFWCVVGCSLRIVYDSATSKKFKFFTAVDEKFKKKKIKIQPTLFYASQKLFNNLFKNNIQTWTYLENVSYL